MDRYSPVVPACIRVQVLPVGRIERPRFLRILHKLRQECAVVPLSRLEVQDVRVGSLSPREFPHGALLYNFSTSNLPEQHHSFSPFELFREPLVVLGIVDGLTDDIDERREELGHAVEYLREQHPRVVHRQLFVLQDGDEGFPVGADNVLPMQEDKLDTAVLRLSSLFLFELATYAMATQAMPTVQTPGQASKGLQRGASIKTNGGRFGSRPSTPTNADISSTTAEESPITSPSRNLASPPPGNNMDNIRPAKSAPNGLSRSDSRASNTSRSSNRASSQDRVSVQGFGPSTSQEKTRNRGKARVGIITAHIHMMAGQWNETLRLLIEHTTKAKSLGDHLWHAKGLEGLAVCLTLLAWAGVEFSIPTICFPLPERSPLSQIKRASVEKSEHSDELRNSASKLSNALPDLVRLTISLYRSGEGNLELPSVVMSEAVIRFAKLLAVLHQANGTLDRKALQCCVEGGAMPKPSRAPAVLKMTIASMLYSAQPNETDNIPVSDRVEILAGIASVYSMINMERKRSSILRDIILLLTGSLNQARKLGAAEAGIHPAASLSAETGAESILSVVNESEGINMMLSELAAAHGATGFDALGSFDRSVDFGNPALRLEVLRELIAFCEASPDPYSVLRFTSAMLQSARPARAADSEPDFKGLPLRKDEQIRLASIMGRTVSISRNLGLPDAQAVFWDPFLLRDVRFFPPTQAATIMKRATLLSKVDADGTTPGNPLLYDPNASRPNTAADEAVVVIQGEPAQCVVTLQNTTDISLDIESLSLITDGVELESSQQPMSLVPNRLQKVAFLVTPESAGEGEITSCRIKIAGCREEIFPIYQKPWAAQESILVKSHGQVTTSPFDNRPGSRHQHPEKATVKFAAVPQQPILLVESTSVLESSLMLLNGEKQTFDVVIKNSSSTPALLFRTVGTEGVLKLVDGQPETVDIRPNESASFHFEVTGRTGVTDVQADFYYTSASGEPGADNFARALSAHMELTVNAALRIQQPNIGPSDIEDGFVLSYDLGNAWPKPLSFACSVSETAASAETMVVKGTLAPGQVERIYLPMKRWSSLTHASDVRHELLQQLHISWEGDGRHGLVDVQELVLTPDVLDLVRGPPVHVSLSIVETLEQISIGSFITVRVQHHNRGAHSTTPLFLQFSARSPTGVVHDNRNIAIGGSLQQFLPPLDVDGKAHTEFAVCPLTSGTFDLVATVRPTDLAGPIVGGEWQTTRSLTIEVT